MHAFALCQIVWFVHILATYAIISIIVFAIAPAQILGTVTLLLSTIACAIIFVAHCLKKRCGSCRRETLNNISSSVCTFIIGTVTIALIATVTLLFVAFVNNGLKSAGMGGFILSLIPPSIIFVISLFVNREFLIKFWKVGLAHTTTGSANARIQEKIQMQMSTTTQADENTNLLPRTVAIQIESNEEEQ